LPTAAPGRDRVRGDPRERRAVVVDVAARPPLVAR